MIPDEQRQERPTLAEALAFTAHDLEQNRSGSLSDAQQSRLQQRAGCSLIGGALIALVLAGAGFWLITLDAWLPAALLFIVACGLFVLNRIGRGAVQTERATGTVATLTGEIALVFNDYATPNGRMNEYLLHLNDEAFVISREAFAAFEDGDRYTLHYLPIARIILSAEPAAE